MAKRRGEDGGMNRPERENPFDALDRENVPKRDESDDVYEGGEYDSIEEDDDDQGMDEEAYASGGMRGFLSSVQGKLLAVAVALLLLILIGVTVWRFAFFKPDDVSGQTPADLPSQGGSASLPEGDGFSDDGSSSVVFAPTGDQTDVGLPDESDPDAGSPDEGVPDEDTSNASLSDDELADSDGLEDFGLSDGDSSDGTGSGGSSDGTASGSSPMVFAPIDADMPSVSEEEEETPLPIILTNTPTPSPTVAPTSTPTPSPEPTATPTPSPTPVMNIGTGKTNRSARLRASMNANGSVKQTLKKGESVTIHEAVLDSENKLWYAVTVDDISTDGWMRDYVIDLDGKLSAPVTTAPAGYGAEEAPELPEGVIGTGRTNRDANVRKIMNGKVLTQLRKNHAVNILEVKQDKNGDTWYRVRTENGTEGYVRDYVITLDRPIGGTEGAGSSGEGEAAGDQSSGVTPSPTVKTVPPPTPNPTAKPTIIPTVPPTASTSPSASAPTGTQTVSGTPEAQAVQTAQTAQTNKTVIGQAYTNREANVRERPVAGAKLVRQLSHGVELRILDKYQTDGAIWYEVETTSGKTHGFARDYVLRITQIDSSVEAKAYTEK